MGKSSVYLPYIRPRVSSRFRPSVPPESTQKLSGKFKFASAWHNLPIYSYIKSDAVPLPPCRTRLWDIVPTHFWPRHLMGVVRVTLRPRFTTGTHWIGGWVGLKADMGTEARGKIPCLCQEPNPSPPVCSQTREWMSYPQLMIYYYIQLTKSTSTSLKERNKIELL
jgi:hypothetical protein